MQQLMTIKELLHWFGLEKNRKNALRILGVLKKLQTEEKIEIMKKIGKHYFVIMPNFQKAFPSAFEFLNKSEESYEAKLSVELKQIKREIDAKRSLEESEKKITSSLQSAIHQYSNVVRQLEKRIARLEAKLSEEKANAK
jgi:septal ring factor EnvC (AmiA/AmiB activator)